MAFLDFLCTQYDKGFIRLEDYIPFSPEEDTFVYMSDQNGVRVCE